MKQGELANIVATGCATPEPWDEYSSAYAEDVERYRQEKDRQEIEKARKWAEQEASADTRPFSQIYYAQDAEKWEKPVETPRRSIKGAASTAGIGLGSATER